jgi:uncharacterized damage-inducible protein DinB
MTNLEFCRARRKAEVPVFVKVLKAIPSGRPEYRPDPKARTAIEIAWLLAQEEAALVNLLNTGTVQWKEQALSASLQDIVAAFERSAEEVNDTLERMNEAAWSSTGRFLMGEGSVWEDTLSQFVWGFLFDEIHHRGQLSTYLRPMGGKVPSIYGPTADDPGA